MSTGRLVCCFMGLAGLALALGALAASGKPVRAAERVVLDRIKIAVNDQAVTQLEFEQTLALQERQLREQFSGEALEQRLEGLRDQVTDRLVEDLLLKSYARRSGIEISDRAIEDRVEALIRRDPRLEEQYTDAQLKRFIIDDLVRSRVVNREVASRVRVTEAEIRAACHRQAEQSREIDVGHILLQEDDPEARQTLLDLRERLQEGAEFEPLARQYSDDPSAENNGGRLGFISPGQFVKPFEEAAFSLEVGEVSRPVQTRFGLHLIKVFDERSTAGVDCDNMQQVTRERIRNNLFEEQREERLRRFLAGLRERATIRVFE